METGEMQKASAEESADFRLLFFCVCQTLFHLIILILLLLLLLPLFLSWWKSGYNKWRSNGSVPQEELYFENIFVRV